MLRIIAMEAQNQLDYKRISQAIQYIREHYDTQPGLEELAEKVHLSPSHFQRMFTAWAGTSPKKFLQYISIEHAKRILKGEQATLFDAAFETGLSGASRLHDLFVKIEGMTPAEYKNGAAELQINYTFANSPFGSILIASTSKGICQMSFEDDETKGFDSLRNKFPNAVFLKDMDENQENALKIFKQDWNNLNDIKLHLKGTEFQLKVWEALLKIPFGRLMSYGSIAENMGNPKASRAVGTAIGKNPIAYLIPCHRVIQSSGNFGDYMWGQTRKTAIIGWEAAKNDTVI